MSRYTKAEVEASVAVSSKETRTKRSAGKGALANLAYEVVSALGRPMDGFDIAAMIMKAEDYDFTGAKTEPDVQVAQSIKVQFHSRGELGSRWKNAGHPDTLYSCWDAERRFHLVEYPTVEPKAPKAKDKPKVN